MLQMGQLISLGVGLVQIHVSQSVFTAEQQVFLDELCCYNKQKPTAVVTSYTCDIPAY